MSYLHDGANARDIAIPKPPTLKTYGLSENEWLLILHDQGYACGVCRKLPSPSKARGVEGKRRFVIDHEHVRGWKRMPSEERKKYVRGLLCYWCNKTYVGRGITVEIARGVVLYLERYAREGGPLA